MAVYTLINEAMRQNITVEELLRRTIAKHNGNVRKASVELDVSTEAIYRHLRKEQQMAVGK